MRGGRHLSGNYRGVGLGWERREVVGGGQSDREAGVCPERRSGSPGFGVRSREDPGKVT